MVKFIPTEKLSKKEKRRLNNVRRKTWGVLNPVTRKPPHPKAYKRKKIRYEETFLDNGFLFYQAIPSLWPRVNPKLYPIGNQSSKGYLSAA